MKKKLIKYATLLCGCVLLSVHASGKPNAEVRQFVSQASALFSATFPDDRPGAAVLIMKDGKTVFEHYYGIADMPSGTPVDKNTRFGIASVSKQFSAMALLQLAEQGKLSLDDPLSKFFPEFQAPFFKRIKLKHILSHTSGIPDARPRHDRNFVLTAKDVESVGYMKTLDRLDFEPGTGKYKYMNPTYELIYQIVERVTGEPFEQYMKRHLFDVAKMKHTEYFDADRVMTHFAHGYAPDNERGGYREYDYGEETFFATKADGGLYTTVRDFALWEKALRKHKIVGRKMLDEAYTPTVTIEPDANYGYQPFTGYGYGFFIRTCPDRQRIVYHTGDNGGFTIYAGKIPETDVLVMIFSSRNDIERMEIVNKLYEMMPSSWTHLPPKAK